MKQMLFRYYQQELSAWILFTPVVCSLFAVPLLFENAEFAAYFILSLSVPVLCAVYLDMRESQLIMTSLFPISRRTFFIVDLSFIGRYTLYYVLYTIVATSFFQTLLKQQLVFPFVKQLLLSFAISFFIIATFLLLRRVKFGKALNYSIFFTPLIITQLLSFIDKLSPLHSAILFSGSLVLVSLAAILAYFRENWRDVT